uniref:Uncharacterized protein n=1 Tax=Moniliophthora roreri TaxID=221103 RepID=A0A0W0FDA4_MONRR
MMDLRWLGVVSKGGHLLL